MLTFFIFVLIVLGGFGLYAMSRTSVDNDPLSRVVPKTDRKCPACAEYLPARKSDRERHLERHVIVVGSRSSACFMWQCGPDCEPDMVWTNSYAAALAPGEHMHKRHSILPAFT